MEWITDLEISICRPARKVLGTTFLRYYHFIVLMVTVCTEKIAKKYRIAKRYSQIRLYIILLNIKRKRFPGTF